MLPPQAAEDRGQTREAHAGDRPASPNAPDALCTPPDMQHRREEAVVPRDEDDRTDDRLVEQVDRAHREDDVRGADEADREGGEEPGHRRVADANAAGN